MVKERQMEESEAAGRRDERISGPYRASAGPCARKSVCDECICMLSASGISGVVKTNGSGCEGNGNAQTLDATTDMHLDR